MLAGILSVAAILLVLLIAEQLRNLFKLNPEITRKFVHISVGCFVASWPFFMPHWVIYVICTAFVSVILISRVGDLFPSIFKVRRKTWGDLFFPFGIALSLWLAHSDWIFAVSILHMSLADGLAALVGVEFGRRTAYDIWGYKKSLAGNITFLLISFSIMYSVASVSGSGIPMTWQILFAVPFIATAIESLSIRGSDNVFVPVSVSWLLNAIKTAIL